MISNIQIAAAEIARIANDLRTLCGDDETLFDDMLEGETDLHELVGRIHQSLAADGELLAGIKLRAADLSERKTRIEARVAVSRAGILKLMQAGRQTKLELPEATYSVRGAKPKLVVVDPDAVPTEYQRIKAEPDKTKINEVFADADGLPNWLAREAGAPSLTARTK